MGGSNLFHLNQLFIVLRTPPPEPPHICEREGWPQHRASPLEPKNIS